MPYATVPVYHHLMQRNTLLDELALRPLCCDGAMATQLFARGLTSGACGMLWNIERPGDVGGIHLAFRDAGCDLITSNSFRSEEHTSELQSRDCI